MRDGVGGDGKAGDDTKTHVQDLTYSQEDTGLILFAHMHTDLCYTHIS